jgi:1-acyl-sn-glycerol-3-phosphate acyltransferase
MTTLRSIMFLVGGVLITAFFSVFVLLGGLVRFHAAAWFASTYAKVMLHWVEASLGIGCQVEGWENVPASPAIIMAKHQSAWETLFMEARFPPQCWIVKKELLWLPFVGWSLMAIRCIAIDRRSGQSAREQIVEQGAKRIKEGMWVSIFPEGTRIAPGKVGRYGIGGAMIGTRTGTPILPIAHNAGEFWGRYSFTKRAGVVKVVIGPLIATAGRDPISVNREVQEWIEGRMAVISPGPHGDA